MPKKKSSSKKTGKFEERYRLLFETSTDAIMILDRNAFIDCNPATLEMFQMEKEEFTSVHPSHISPSKQANGKSSKTEANRRIKEAFEKGHNKFEWLHKRSDGEVFPATVWLTAFELEGKQVLQATVRDISHQKQLEAQLEDMVEKKTRDLVSAEREVQRLIQAVGTSMNAIAIFDMDLNLTYGNLAYANLADMDILDMDNTTATDFIAEDSLGIVMENIQRALAGEEIDIFEIKSKTSKGEVRWVEVMGSVVYDEKAEPEGILCVIKDITEQRELRESLSETREKYELLVEKANDGILIIQDGKVGYMNPALLRLSQYSMKEQKGRDFLENVAPEERNKVKNIFKVRMKGKKAPRIYETVFLKKDGTRVPVEVNATVMEYQGRPADFVYLRDLTDRKAAEEEIKEVKEQFEYALGVSETGFYIMDQDFEIIYVDPKWAGRLGNPAGKKCYEYFNEEEEICQGCSSLPVLDTGEICIVEKYLEKDDKYIEVHSVPLEGPDGKTRVAKFVRDISSRKLAENELRESNEKLREVTVLLESLYDSIPDIIGIQDGKHNVIRYNQAGYEFLDMTPEEVAGKKCYELIGRKSRCDICATSEVYKTKKPARVEKYMDELDIWLDVRAYPVLDGDGEIIRVIEHLRDITKQKKAEKKILESEKRYRNLVQENPLGIFEYRLDEDGELIFSDSNPAADSILGVKCHSFLGMTIGEAFPNLLETEVPEAYTRVIKTGMPWHSEQIEYHEGGINGAYEVHAFQTGPDRMAVAFRDITEKKLAEKALKQSEEKYRLLMETANDAIFLADAETGKIIGVNKTGENLIGRRRKEIIGMKQTKLHPKGEAKRYAKIFRDHIEDGSAISEDIYVQHKDGRKIPVMISASTFELDGRVVNQGIFHDLTRRKRAENALRESEEKFRTLANTSSAAIFIHKGGRFLFFNRATQDISGYSKKELHSMNFLDVVHPDYKGKVKESAEARLKGEKGPNNYEIKILKKDGSEAWLNLTGESIVFEGEGAVIGTAMDITDRKRMEKKMEELRDFSKSTIDNSPVGILTTDMEGNIQIANPALLEMLGSPGEEETLKFNVLTLEPLVEQGFSKLFRQCLEKEKKISVSSIPYSSLWGKESIVSIDIVPLKDPDGEQIGLLSLIEDITEKHKAREALISSEKIYRSLYESTIALADTTDLYEVIAAIAEQARIMLDGECSTIYLWDEFKKELVPFYTNAEGDKGKFMRHLLKLGEGLTGTVAKEKRGRYVNYDQDRKGIRGYIPGTKTDRDHLQSIIAEPMLAGNRLIGVINVIAEEHRFGEEDLTRMEILAHQASIAHMRTKNIDALTRSEARFRRMVENIHDGLTIIENGKVVYINERACEIFGYPMDELMEMSLPDLMSPEDRDQVIRFRENAEEMGMTLGEMEFWIEQKDGTRRYVRTRTSTSYDGDSISEFIITTDITDRKLAEEEAKRNKMKYILEDGRAYLVTEFKPEISLEAFNDLVSIDYQGIIISRTPKKDLNRKIQGAFEHVWLGEAEEDLFDNLTDKIKTTGSKTVILIDRLDYLIFKYGFNETLALIYSFRDIAYMKDQVMIFSMDPSTVSEEQLNLVRKEMTGIEQRQVPRPSEELYEIVEKIYEKNSTGAKPSYSEIGSELGVSKPTFRKRVRRLISGGYVSEFTKGNKKVLELTQKGRSLFFK